MPRSLFRDPLHVGVCPVVTVSNRSTHLRDKNLDFLKGPAQNLADGIDREAIQAQVHVEAGEHANLLEPRILRPRAVGNLELLVRDVDEAGIFGPGHHVLLAEPELASDLVAGLVKDLVPLVVHATSLR